jgi:beta-lactamase regulating signal transducer with metallopeptidase domain
MIIICQKLLKLLKINGIALFPFILIRKLEDKENKVLINHEKIHLRQQLEMLMIFFYFFYLIEYYYWLLKLKNSDQAYRRISFESEAYANESNLNYLKERKFWGFRKYL